MLNLGLGKCKCQQAVEVVHKFIVTLIEKRCYDLQILPFTMIEISRMCLGFPHTQQPPKLFLLFISLGLYYCLLRLIRFLSKILRIRLKDGFILNLY